jgi:tripartite-type tricarboxylate transporter receptor subunit TctC
VKDFAVSYDTVKDFAPVAMLCKTSLRIAVGAQSPYKTLADLVRAMKARPGEITFASGGNVSAAHLCMSMLTGATQTSAKHVAYRSSVSGVMDVATGIVDFTCQGSGSILPCCNRGDCDC